MPIRKAGHALKYLSRLTSLIGFKEAISILKALAVLMIFTLALGVRLFPFKWGPYLTAYDPYFQYRATKYIIENGFQAWFTWKDEMSWYPYGRDIANSAYPGVPFTGAVFYILLRSLGIHCSLMEACTFLPALLGALTSIMAYLVAREIEGEIAGLIAGLLLATSPAFISRTVAGFYDTESVGLFAMMISLYCLVKAIKTGSMVMAILSGLALAYMNLSWGGGLFLLNLYAVYAVLVLILGRYDRKLLTTYSTTIGIALLVTAQVPIFVRKYLISHGTILPIAVAMLLSTFSAIKEPEDKRSKIAGLMLIIPIIVAGLAIIQSKGYLTRLSARIFTVINPMAREAIPLVASVAEHRTPTWGYIFLQYGCLIVLASIGIYFMLKRASSIDILLSLGGLFSIYFASTMIRLLTLAAPITSVLAGIGTYRVLKPHIDILTGKIKTIRRGRKVVVRISRSGSAFVLLIMIALLASTVTSWRGIAFTPQTIVTCGGIPGGTKYKDWIEALLWMRVNLPNDAVVASWWDTPLRFFRRIRNL